MDRDVIMRSKAEPICAFDVFYPRKEALTLSFETFGYSLIDKIRKNRTCLL